MRVILAAISSLGFMLLAVVILLGPLEGKVPDSVATAVIVLTFVLAILGSCIVFNRHNERWPYQTIEEMEKEGVVVSAEFRAKRAFQVEEVEDEGLHYYLELIDGSVLYLSGQYLYDHEPIDDDSEIDQERKFPCTEFLIKRHRTEGYALEIVTGGIPFEAEEIVPQPSRKYYRFHTVPEDGDIIHDKSYDQIKREWLNM
jgi:hypothetical protein